MFIHDGGHDPVGEHWYNDTHSPDLCCGSIPKGVNVSTVMHKLPPGDAWPEAARPAQNPCRLARGPHSIPLVRSHSVEHSAR